VNNHFFASGFSMPHAVVSTWNRDLIEENFKAIGEEFFDVGYNLINGPVASPLGRVPEGFSPDPYLSGIAMAKSIAGMQSAGVIAVGRHFLLNEQETNRSSGFSTRYSSNADDKMLHEVYAWPFYDATKAGMVGVMYAMNRVNDTLSCENGPLPNKLLKTEMGFGGMVLPDVMSQQTAYGSANGGLDYATSSFGGGGGGGNVDGNGSAPGGGNSSTFEGDNSAPGGGNSSTPTAGGSTSSALWTETTLIAGINFVGLDTANQSSVADATGFRDVRRNHSDVIRRVGREALALLKNDNANGLGLPLNMPKTIALFGAHAGPVMAGPNLPFSVAGTESDIYQGHLASGGGSGELSLGYLSTPFQALSERVVKDRSTIWWLMNNTYTSGEHDGLGGGALGLATSVTPSFENYAQNAEVCLFFINAASGEGADRSSLLDTDQDNVTLTVASNCNNTVVVANVAGSRVISAWADHETLLCKNRPHHTTRMAC
jgi:beta-glucosidase